MTVTKFGLALAGLAFSATAAFAQQAAFKPAVVYDLGGKFDKSFNEGVHMGAEKFKKDTGAEYRDFEPQNDAQREQALRRFARDGFCPIVAVGFSQETALKKVAEEFPKIKFAIIDAVVEKPNVQSIVFKEHEGSFLVGLLAAQASKTGKVGFVGGMDIPLIRKFACGYVQGVKYAKKDAEVFQNMTGTTGAAWNDPVKGGELAKSQIDRGADVVYHAAGGTGIGVLRAAADAGKLGIGVDFEPERHASRQDADLDGQARRRRHLQRLRSGQEEHLQGRRLGARPQGRRRRLGARRQQQGADHRRHEGRRRQGR